MSEVINLPQLGFDMREGTFLNWIKQVGETITTGETLAEIESDKATIEVPAPASGVLLQTLVNTGDVVAVGAPIAMLGAAGEKVAASTGSAPSQPADTGNTADQAPSKALTAEKAESPAPVAASNGNSAVAVQAQSAAAQPTALASDTAPAEEDTLPGGIKASPLARKMAEERHLDLRQVQGSGPNGRIIKLDVETYKAPAQAPAVIPPAALPAAVAQAIAPRPQAAAPSGPGIQEIPLTRLRQRIASRMVESKQTIPHFYVTTEVDMAAVLTLRKQINESLQETHKVSVNDIVIKAVALTLRQFPNLNSHFYGDKLIRYEHINIGIAVALDAGGLMNVVAKDADTTPISTMAARNKEMIASARSGKVKPADVEGSTFTVSNLGAYEVENFVAIINPPEAGILAVGSAMQVPVVVNGELKIGTRMKCTLSVDHRVSDGAEGAQFMQAFKKLLEAPMRLLI